jgi:hypothetical protein
LLFLGGGAFGSADLVLLSVLLGGTPHAAHVGLALLLRRRVCIVVLLRWLGHLCHHHIVHAAWRYAIVFVGPRRRPF